MTTQTHEEYSSYSIPLTPRPRSSSEVRNAREVPERPDLIVVDKSGSHKWFFVLFYPEILFTNLLRYYRGKLFMSFDTILYPQCTLILSFYATFVLRACIISLPGQSAV